MNWPLGRPVAVNGLKFLMNVTSPEPVMTRHLWAAATSLAPATVSVRSAAGVAAARNAADAAQPATTTAASQRVERRLRRIDCPFLALPCGRRGYRRRSPET